MNREKIRPANRAEKKLPKDRSGLYVGVTLGLQVSQFGDTRRHDVIVEYLVQFVL